jgi:putative hydrolase of the HAD superfamily
MPEAVLLDLDDTILDDSSQVEDCWRCACDTHCAELAGTDSAAVYDAVRAAGEWFWGDPERHRAGRLDLNRARTEVVRLALDRLNVGHGAGLAEQVADTYSRLRDDRMEPLPDAIDTIRWFRNRGVRLALLTNGAGDAQRRKIARFDLERYFDTILVEGEVGFGKPDERIYQRALRELSVKPGDAWMVGDHLEFDVEAPQRLGLFTIWIDAKGAGVPAHSHVRPDRIVRALSELQSDTMLVARSKDE